jgi:hypothetical protein
MALEEAVFEMTFLCEIPKDEDVPTRIVLNFLTSIRARDSHLLTRDWQALCSALAFYLTGC